MKRKIFYCSVICTVLVSWLPLTSWITGCSFFQETLTVTVELPAEPFPWKPFIPVPYKLIYPDKSGNLTTLQIPPGNRQVTIHVRKGDHIPIAAYPGGNCKPAGAVFPHDIDNGTVRLSWNEGFLSHYLIKLFPWQGMEVLNIPALRQEINKKSGKNPWHLDGNRLIHALKTFGFTAGHVSSLPVVEIHLPAYTGVWLPESPLTPEPITPEAQEGGQGLSITLPVGIHSFLNPRTSDIMRVSVQEDTWEVIIRPQQY